MRTKLASALTLSLCAALLAFLLWPRAPRVAPTASADATAAPAPLADEPAAAAAATSPSRAAAATVPSADPGPSPTVFLEAIPRPASAERWEAAFKTPTQQIRYVRVDAAQVDGKHSPFWQTDGSGRFNVTLANGEAVTVIVENTTSQGPRRFVSSGRIEGRPESRALFAYNEGELSGSVEDFVHGTWQLRAMGDGVSQWFKVDPMLIPSCGVTAEVMNPQKVQLLQRRAAAAKAMQAGTDAVPPTRVEADGGRSNLRILMVYTDAVARATSPGALQAEFDLAIQTLNSDFAASLIDARASLAGSLQVAYADDDIAGDGEKVQDDALGRLADVADGFMDAVHAYRDLVQADLVCLIHRRGDTESAGIAYLLEDPGQVANPILAFSVVEFSYLTPGQRTFSHEIGHNLGCAHDREHAKDTDDKPTEGAYPYSYGYRFTGADGVQYRTIMAYDPGRRLSYFSNPDVTAPAPISRPVGIASGQTGEADNARTIRQLAFEVNSYRLSPQAPTNPGRLINVSTRAFVGSGSQQLIGGLIISGTEPKRLLVRAVGPSLASLGVTGVLPDPKMRLVRLRTGLPEEHIADNDNWAPADLATMKSVGAFDLPSGSRDAAVVATVAPGNYTANIEGVSGATGIALIEAYELDRAGTRFANLSTRGYTDRARPMIGGFVLAADPAHPGKTKRVVIRVQGPSLARHGLTDFVYDPMFTLHDSTNAQILQNDDWSSGSAGGDDSKPVVQIYAEQQLSAVGLAPGNRRDSGVMVDLLPGRYTVVVFPFEQLPDQPERPGVAVVEVFEVN